MNPTHALGNLALGTIQWSATFALSHLAVRQLGLPDSRSLPLALAAGTAWITFQGLRKPGQNSAPRGKEKKTRSGPNRRHNRFSPPRQPFLLTLADPDSALPPPDTGGAVGLSLPYSPDPAMNERWNGEENWRRLLDWLAGKQTADLLLGLVVVLDSGRLLQASASTLLRDAGVLKEKLTGLNRVLGKSPPVYLLADNLDLLYGLRSLTSVLSPSRLAAPLGAWFNPDRDRNPAAAAKTAHAKALESLRQAAAVTPHSPPASTLAALLQAPDEFKRLEAPLTRFAAELFGNGGEPRNRSHRKSFLDEEEEDTQRDDANAAPPRFGGLFFTASGPGAVTLPPQLGELAGILEATEPAPGSDPWFTQALFSRDLVADAKRQSSAAKPKSARRTSAAGAGGLAWFTAAGLVFCLVLGCLFLKDRQQLLTLSENARAPESAEELGDYLNLARKAREHAGSFLAARFGLGQTRELAEVIQRRYVESYYDLKTIPAIASLQESVLAAADHTDPAVIGNTLLMLIILRDGIMGGDNAADPGDISTPLHAIAEAKGLLNRDDLRQLFAFSAWSGDRAWLVDANSAIQQLLERLVHSANRGDPAWLGEWLGGIPGLREVQLDKLLDSPRPKDANPVTVPAAYSQDGYRVAAAIMDKLGAAAGEEIRRQYLRRYRDIALEAWRLAAAELLQGGRESIADPDLRERIRQAVRQDDPAARFAALASRHLLPMFDLDAEEDEPDFLWLAEYARLSGLTAANPSAQALPQTVAPQSRERRENLAAAGSFTAMAARFSSAIRGLTGDSTEEAWLRQFAGLNLDQKPNPGPGPYADQANADQADARLFAGPERDDAWANWRGQLKRVGLVSQDPAENLSHIRKLFAWRREQAEPAADLPLTGAELQARRLHRHLREYSGSGRWDFLSPLASQRRLGQLLTRLAALTLEAVWRDTVYNPLRLTAGNESSRQERMTGAGGLLEKFLTGPAAGFWDWEDGHLVNASRDGLTFMFAPAFLAYCNEILSRSREPLPPTCDLVFKIDSVNVDPGARERPEAVEFFLSGVGGEKTKGNPGGDPRRPNGGTEQTFTHRNFPKAHPFSLSPEALLANPACRAGVRIQFRSCQIEAVFTGAEGVRRFIGLFSQRGAVLRPDAFGLDGGMLLKKLRVSGVMVNGEILGGEEFLSLPHQPLPDLPERIISPPPAGVMAGGDAFGRKVLF